MDKQNGKGLVKYLSPLSVWGLSFGCIVGWGAFIMPGTTFLPLAGPVGTAIGIVFLITASLIMISLPIILIQQIQDRWSEFFGDTVSILFKYGVRTFGIGFQQVKRFFNNACIAVHDCYSLQ